MTRMERFLFLLLLPVSTCPANVPRLTIRALKGSCVVIPCAFSNPEPRKAPAGLRIGWFGRQEASTVTIYSDQGPADKVTPAYRGRTAFVGDLGRGDCSLQINNVSPSDAGGYYPWIEPLTKDYELYTVQFSDKPDEPSLSNPGELTEGTPVRINCSAVHTCPPHPPTLTWNWDMMNASIRHEDLGGGSWKVISETYFIPIFGDNNAPLECTAAYSESVTSKKSITLQIRYPPKNTSAVVKGDAVLREGDDVTLVCSADGDPAVSHYSWSEGQSERALPGDGQEITLKNIRWDSGPYYCTARNEVGVGKSAPLNASITYAPKGTNVVGPMKPPHNGDQMTFECCTERSNPAVERYTWYKDGNLLENQTEKRLHIENVTPTDSGSYHCEAHNTVGRSASAFANITVSVMASQELSTSKSFAVLGGTIAFLLLLLLALFLLLWSSRKKKKEGTVQRQPAQPKVTEEVVYVTIDHSKRRGTQRRSMPSDDYVTYAAVKSHSENEAVPVSDVTYAQVKKPNRSPKSNQKDDEIVDATDLKFQHQTPNGQNSHNEDNVVYAAVKR